MEVVKIEDLKKRFTIDWSWFIQEDDQPDFVYLAEAVRDGTRMLKIGHTWSVEGRRACST